MMFWWCSLHGTFNHLCPQIIQLPQLKVDELRELIKAPLPNINQEENSSPNANNSENMNMVAENELEAAVQEKFREWLVSSGQIREVADLIGLERQK